MPRKPRYFLPNIPVHVVHRGHSRSPVFFQDEDYRTYLYWMKEAAEKYRVRIHSFVLMTNHIHILLTPCAGSDVSSFMQYLGRHYVPYINHKYGTSGSIWEGRFKGSLVQQETYFLSVMRYIELNPVRASMVEYPSQYRWSSFCHNAGDKVIRMISQHDIYNSLGQTDQQRSDAYKELFNSTLDSGSLKKISAAWLTGTPLGNNCFRSMVEETFATRVGQDRRGRPSKREKRALTP